MVVMRGSGSTDNEGQQQGVASLIHMLGALGGARSEASAAAWPEEQTADVMATRSDLQNATEEVVALVLGEALQPSILRIDADAVQAHCTLPLCRSVICCFSMMT